MTIAQRHNNIGIDWGSTSFRAYLFDANYDIHETLCTQDGIKNTPREQFASTLQKLIGHWFEPSAKIILSGMVTSRLGWVETPYLPVPTDVKALLEHAIRTPMVKHQPKDVQLVFLPGLCQHTPHADVIRGEELQLFGVSDTADHSIVVMPGTHSKWATLKEHRVESFQTIMTGGLITR